MNAITYAFERVRRRSGHPPRAVVVDGALLADFAVTALIDEARLTPKPALVDRRGRGAHADLDLTTMLRSANSLRGAFAAMAGAAFGQEPSQSLRETLAVIGRDGERAMFAATGGSNTHRGAIWVLGLLTAGVAMAGADRTAEGIAARAAEVARYPDRFAPAVDSNGSRVCTRYGVAGARGEAAAGFPHVANIGLPELLAGRARGLAEEDVRLDVLMSIMASLDDTCLLHRGGRAALTTARRGARAVLEAGGASTAMGRQALFRLDAKLLALNASPGGSADLLAAVLFLDHVGARPERMPRPSSAWR
jgi:triphosphoribosyl-dephospho-CoA synthase